MIRENLIEVKTFVSPSPQSVIDELAAIVTAMPGKVAVLCDPPVTEQQGILVAPGKYKGSQDSDSGTVIATGVSALKVGDRVGFLPMHGLRCTHEEFDWVPEGLEVRFYGVACPYHESLIVLAG